MTFDPPLPPSLWPLVYRLAGREDWPPKTPDDARVLIDRATRDDLLPILFDDDSAPAVVRDALQSMRAVIRIHERRAEIMAAALREVADALEGMPFAVLKGGEYAYRLYPRPWHRPFRDLDLFIPREATRAATARLLERGFTIADIYGPDANVDAHHERAFRRGDVTFDVHHSFIQRARADIDYDAIWKRCVPARIGGVDCLRLCDADALFYQAFSISVHELHVTVMRYVDLERMVSASADAFAEAAANARRWHTRRAFFASVRQAERVFPELSPLVGPALDDLVDARTRARLERHVLPDPGEAATRYALLPRRDQLRRKLLLIDDSYRRLRFGAYYLWAHVAGRGR
jgi:Uncharacterised nucleotidyltransferase